MPMARGLERRGQSASTIANNYDISGGGMGKNISHDGWCA